MALVILPLPKWSFMGILRSLYHNRTTAANGGVTDVLFCFLWVYIVAMQGTNHCPKHSTFLEV